MKRLLHTVFAAALASLIGLNAQAQDGYILYTHQDPRPHQHLGQGPLGAYTCAFGQVVLGWECQYVAPPLAPPAPSPYTGSGDCLDGGACASEMTRRGRNRRNNPQIDRIAAEVGLSAEQRDRLHDRISGQGLSDEEVREEAEDIKAEERPDRIGPRPRGGRGGWR